MFCLPISSFLPNPNPKHSEPAAVETPEQFKGKKTLFCLPTSNFLPNRGPEPSEPAAVETPGAVLSRKALVLLADKEFSAKSWFGAIRTGRRGWAIGLC